MQPTTLLPLFPHSVENWWWIEACNTWPEMSEDKLLNLIRKELVKQSDRFNKFRDFDPDSYGKRDLSILAYGNFYFSRTWSAMTYAMGEAIHLRGWEAPKKGPIRILDIGSGTGASGLSCLHMIRSLGIDNHIQLDAVDYSSKSLAFLKKLHSARKELWPDTRVNTTRLDLKFPADENKRKKYDLIILGYSLNELIEDDEQNDPVECYKKVIHSIPGQLKNNGLAVITEPAQGNLCHLLHQCIAELTKEDKELYIHAPYFNGMQCPLAESNSKYFSHEVRKILPLSTVEKINRPLNLEIREVKFGLSMLGYPRPKKIGSNFQVCRIISPLKKRKGTVSFIGMAANEQEYTYELQRRDLKKEELIDLMSLNRGDIIQVDVTEDAISANQRIRILSIDQIHTLYMPRIKQL
jgi:SAM-dependent methyltransferase